MCIVGRTNKEWIQILWYMSTGMSARGGALVAAKRACAEWNMQNNESDIIYLYRETGRLLVYVKVSGFPQREVQEGQDEHHSSSFTM